MNDTARTAGRRLVIALRTGRLANRLILFANVIAFAEERGYRVLNPAFQSYAGMFEPTRPTVLSPYPAPPPHPVRSLLLPLFAAIRWTRLLYHVAFGLTRAVNRFPALAPWIRGIETPVGPGACELGSPAISSLIEGSRLVLLRDWGFRYAVGVPKYGKLIRAFFVPVARHRDAIAAILRRARADCDLLVGVHVRHGDYRRFLSGRYYFDYPEYAHLMRRVRDIFPSHRLGFLVCSDGAPRPNDFPGGLRIYVSSGVAVEDLYALAGCDLLIGPPSTFTQWASFYGKVPLYHAWSPDAAPTRDDFAVADLGLISFTQRMLSMRNP
ncbi:MAG: hypothetical protein ACHBNF_16335 [Chromatiales bacterium]